MATLRIGEETPLLDAHRPAARRTPLPWEQMSLTLFLQLVEPLTSQVIYPFPPQLIRDVGITHGDETKVGYYVGMLESIFFVAQALTILKWSRVSDRIGRKPVILTGLFGLSLSMYCFGLSKTFVGFLISRSLTGALNGNVGIMKTLVAEITGSTNISQAYAYMPISWSTGNTLGPIIGGFLARPADRYPSLFGESDFLKTYPYFLPCAVPATFSVIAWLITFLYFKETVPAADPLSHIFRRQSKNQNRSDLRDGHILSHAKPTPLQSLLTFNVIIASANYATLAFVDIAFRAIQPLYFSTPRELGGLGLPPSDIGTILSAFGIFNGLFQLFFFAQIQDKWGSKKVFTAGMASALPLFGSFPLLTYMVEQHGFSTLVWVLVYAQVVLSVGLGMSYGSIFIYINAASPNRASLGAINGLAQMAVCIVRATGPAIANSLFSLSITNRWLGGSLVYCVLTSIVILSLVVASMLPKHI